MKKYLANLSFLFASTLFSAASASDIPEKEPPGARDHPVVSRFAGSVIIGYQTSDFDEMTVPLAPLEGRTFGKVDSSKGRITRIAYLAPPGKSELEISSNFEQALQNAGFQKRFGCRGTADSEACGNAFDVSDALIPDSRLSRLAANHGDFNAMNHGLWSFDKQIFLETARLERADGPVDLVLLVTGNEGKPSGIYLQICETKAMATGQVSVDAKGMAQGLSRQGHVALYGIHLGTDSATIEAESNPTLGEMASLMKSQPALKVYIVGHTDNSGALEHNLTLSTQRAQAVLKALQNLGVPAARMAAKGMASFGPVATNATDEGKAKNRRVELVEQ
jgi:outer membrane protein OmpA-like peptidoglycan-associated protein